MKTIQTKPDCTLGFAKSDKSTNELNNDVLIYGTACATVDTNPYTLLELVESKKVVGWLSEVSEEQAKELLESSLVNGFCCYKNYMDSTNWYFGASVLMSLQSAALSVGIEEKDFDKYLIVKL
jgi:hypothetical protein